MGQLSPDGHWQWDGWRWVPARPLPPPRRAAAPRAPTLWTRRLQILLLVIAGFGLVSAVIWAALLPSQWAGQVQGIVAQWRSQGIPAGEIATLERFMSGLVWALLIFVLLWELALCTLQVVGTLRRWVWWYWVQFAICCLSALSLLITLFDVLVLAVTAAGGPPTLTMSRPEAATIPLTLIGDLLNVGAGICMLIAAIRIGPWATRRDPAGFGVR